MSIQVRMAEAPIEGFHLGVIGRSAWPDEFQLPPPSRSLTLARSKDLMSFKRGVGTRMKT